MEKIYDLYPWQNGEKGWKIYSRKCPAIYLSVYLPWSKKKVGSNLNFGGKNPGIGEWRVLC
jgi:hypothetical protein